MCEECEAEETMAQSYAVKRALISRYWRPKGASAGKRWMASEVEAGAPEFTQVKPQGTDTEALS